MSYETPRKYPYEEFSRKLGQRLYELRTEQKISQEYIAQRAGISAYTYQKFEKGESKPGTPMNPQLYTLLALADAFGVSLKTLITFK